MDDNELNRVLEDFDIKHKVNEDDPKTKEIVTASETLVNGILQAVGEIDTRFKSKCIYSGSYYDELKVGSADEFDFVARIESLSRKGALVARRSERKRGFVYLVVKDVSYLEGFKQFLTSPDDDPCLEENDVILDVDAFQDYFEDLIFTAVKSIDIPDSFILVNKLDDNSDTQTNWRPNRHGPCATLYLSYMCQTTLDVVNLDIDIAPSIAYPEMQYIPPVLEKLKDLKSGSPFLEIVENICFATEVMLVPFRFDYTEPSGKASWHYHYSNTWRVSHSSIEKAVFSLYEKDSVEKKLCRILKILKEIYLQGTEEVVIKSDSGRLKLLEPPSTRLDFCTIEAVTSISEEFSTETEDTDEESEDISESQSSYEECGGEEDETCKQTGESDKIFAHGEKISNDQVGVTEAKYLDQTQFTYDQNYEILYDRKAMVKLQYSPPVSTRSSTVSSTENQFISDHTQSDMKIDADVTYKELQKFQNKPKLSCEETEPGVLYKELESPCSTLSSYIYERTSEMGNRNAEASQTSYIPSDEEKVNPEDNQVHELCYRDSKPLLKTYMIKMLFLAMKTAYPYQKSWEPNQLSFLVKMAYPYQKSWEPNQLSFLVKMAMCMIYFAHMSKEKGIYNYWFQDLIENRTRNSTCTEILYCLDHVVIQLSKILQVNLDL